MSQNTPVVEFLKLFCLEGVFRKYGDEIFYDVINFVDSPLNGRITFSASLNMVDPTYASKAIFDLMQDFFIIKSKFNLESEFNVERTASHIKMAFTIEYPREPGAEGVIEN